MDEPLVGTREEARLPVTLAAALLVMMAPSFWLTPEGPLNWLLEVGPGLVGMIALAVSFRRFPLSRWVYVAVFLHILVLLYGGHYTYAKAPLGEWMKEWFGFARNNYDKIGHVAFGFFPVFVLREVLLRQTPLRDGGWLRFILINVILGFAAAYELFEWGAAVLLDPEGGDRFLGTQGFIWDAQADMLAAGVGAAVALLLFTRAHDRSLAALLARAAARAPTARPAS